MRMGVKKFSVMRVARGIITTARDGYTAQPLQRVTFCGAVSAVKFCQVESEPDCVRGLRRRTAQRIGAATGGNGAI